MKRIAFMSLALLLGSLMASADVGPNITILKPIPGTYPMYDTVEIKWSHSAYFDPYHMTCTIFCGENIISPPVQVTADSFIWTVGRKADGTYMPEGNYTITIESLDYDALSGPTITIGEPDPRITITAPADNSTLTWGSKCMVRWTYSTYFNAVPQTCEIFCGETVISPPVPVTNGQFEWTVGTKVRGVDLAVGDYKITLESPDYDALSGPDVTLALSFPPFAWRFIEKIPLYKAPGCPMCFQIDPRDLKFDPQALREPVRIVIARGRHIFAKLGEFAPGKAAPGPVRVTLEREVHNFIKSGQRGFELRVVTLAGKILHQQPIMLEIVR